MLLFFMFILIGVGIISFLDILEIVNLLFFLNLKKKIKRNELIICMYMYIEKV